MAKRDPELTLHNKEADRITAKLKELEAEALHLSGRHNLQSLHAAYGGKNDVFVNTKDTVIHTPEQFVSIWLEGYMRFLTERQPGFDSAYVESFERLQRYDVLQEYVFLFLERTFHRNYRALTRVRPTDESNHYWIGQQRASYGLFITPRFKNRNWENDRSEIRYFPHQYWTIGHILATGLVIPFREEVMRFGDLDQYLTFFRNTLVRLSGSSHEDAVAERYCKYVRAAERPEKVPLLIPEIRYGGLEAAHKHRLDFCIVRQETNQKIGFELSPWSTHGQLTGLKGKTQAEINAMAQENFEDEMAKVKNYFRERGIFVMIFTDRDLKDPDGVFRSIARFLGEVEITTQLKLSVMGDFKAFKVPAR